MLRSVLKSLSLIILLTGCVSISQNKKPPVSTQTVEAAINNDFIWSDTIQPMPLTDLSRTQDGAFILAPGFYESEFKTYCLQPGTPDPSAGDAYLPGEVTGYRKDIIESVLINSRNHPEIEQKSMQLLLWSAVSGADFNKLSSTTKADAMKLLTPKQIFELKGGVGGMIKTVSNSTGIFKANSDMQRLFDKGISSYETYERIAVRREAAQIKRPGIKFDQWYKQEENYYVRYFPLSYKKVRIQIYMPDNVLDSTGKLDNEYVIFDPTGQQANPAFTNAQKLGIGVPVKDIIKVIVEVSKKKDTPRKTPEKKIFEKKDKPVSNPKQY